ncbi:MMPL family transporter [Rhodocyclus tenuis]|uniref:MMPL family transporter n=1 Tax=Rhodocyclus tenuis TaxID=1066 RepID=UPI00190840ED|nr:MMPL family transporter [Rhodocyclus tenuis]MBK1680594.1 hypothetical protein [Rhodocyclus tenuis]
MKLPGRALALSVWAGLMLACVWVIAQTHFVADLSAFLPKAPTARQQMLVDQLRDGAIARLVIIGIEGGNAAERARLSLALAEELRANPAFSAVQNGAAETQDKDRKYFFDNRYLLSPAVDAEHFSDSGLRQSIGNSIAALSGDAGLILKAILPRDPTGETLHILEQFSGESQPRSQAGAWASSDGKRALILAQIRDSGLNTDAQAAAIEAIRAAFERIPERDAATRLVMSGTSVLSVSSRNTIETEVSRLAVASIILVVCLLLLVYRSFRLLGLGLLPVASGAAAGIAAVSLVFGHVHGLTLGFGTTLIGEAVDYSIYLFVQRAGGNNPDGFWRTIRLGVLTSIAGFAALLWSSFPGLAQLGLYSISGLVAAALVTRYVLPQLMSADMAVRDLTRPARILDSLIDRATGLRWLIYLLIAAAAIVLLRAGDIWNRQLSALSPVSAAEQQLDTELRSDLGGTNLRYMASFTASDEQSALVYAERVGSVLRELSTQQVIGGFNSPAFVLPSSAAQRARQAALPAGPEARARLAGAVAGMPIKAERLDGFIGDLEAARTRPLLGRADVKGSSAEALLDSLLIKREHDYLVLMPLRAPEGAADDLIDLRRVDAALAAKGINGVAAIDLLEETTSIFDSYLREALILSGLGCLAILVMLLLALRSLSRALRITLPLAGAVLCVTAVLVASGTQLTILHLIGLLLVVALGTNYALFFDSGAQPETRGDVRQMLVSLLVANLATVASFGVLGFSKVPILAAIGTTVGPGALLALAFSAILARAHDHAHAR